MSWFFSSTSSATAKQPVGTEFAVARDTTLTLTSPWLSRNANPAFLGDRPVTLVFTGEGLKFGGAAKGAPTTNEVILRQPGTDSKVAGTYRLAASGTAVHEMVTSGGNAQVRTTFTGRASHLMITVDNPETGPEKVAEFDLQALNPEQGPYYGREMETTIVFGKEVTMTQRPHTSRFEDCRDTAKACPAQTYNCLATVARCFSSVFTGGIGGVKSRMPTVTVTWRAPATAASPASLATVVPEDQKKK